MNRQRRRSGMPGGGTGRTDRPGRSGVYPASGPYPTGNAELREQAAWGQGDRGAVGFEDHGDSEMGNVTHAAAVTAPPAGAQKGRRRSEPPAQTVVRAQRIPVKLYRGIDRLTLALPMAGLEPEDIEVEVTEDGRIDIHGQLRGLLKGEKDILADEWNPGPYHRELRLPVAVDGGLANLTYGNGVLVVALPLSAQTRPATLRLERAGPQAQGGRVGNAGSPPLPVVASRGETAIAAR